MSTKEKEVENFVKNVLGVGGRSNSQVGMVPSNSKRFKKGLDEIDLEAMRQGNAERGLSSYRPRTKHVYCR